jgi:hypothetical protein
MQLLGTLPGGRGYSCQVTLTRGTAAAAAASSSSAAHQCVVLHQIESGAAGGGSSNAWVGMQQTAPGAKPESSSGRASTPCKLLVGCSSTDDLLLLRGLVLETFQSPMQVRMVLPPSTCRSLFWLSCQLGLEMSGQDKESTCMALSTWLQGIGSLFNTNQPS